MSIIILTFINILPGCLEFRVKRKQNRQKATLSIACRAVL